VQKVSWYSPAAARERAEYLDKFCQSGSKTFITRINNETSIDEVIHNSGLPSSAVSVALLSLEMKRMVKQLPGKLFVKNR
jgi:predicted Rossmann fold nucleotide-binding protein DprA/Smf involved in DNA uptake